MGYVGAGIWRDVSEAVLRTGRMMDTSPPSWELRSARQRRNVYVRQRVSGEQFCFPFGFSRLVMFTAVNGKMLLGALGVNTLIRKRFRELS